MAYTQKNNPFKQKTSTVTISDVSQSDIDLAQRLNKMRFEMGQIYPIVSEEQVRKDVTKDFTAPIYDSDKQHMKAEMERRNLSYKESKNQMMEERVQEELKDTAQNKEERMELYAQDPSGKGYDIDKFKTWIGSGATDKQYQSKEDFDKWLYKKDLKFVQVAKEAGGETFNKITSLSNKDLVGFQNEVIKVAKPLVGLELGEDAVSTLNEVRKLDLTGFKPYLEKAGISKSDIKNIITAQISNMPDENEDGVPDVFEGVKGKILRSGVDTLVDFKLKDLK